MCGIVGLFLKNPALEGELGRHLKPMLIEMSERGPDSAGIAVYGHDAPRDWLKITLYHPDITFDWASLEGQLRRDLKTEVQHQVRANHAVFSVKDGAARALAWLKSHAPDVRVMAAGKRIELFKDVGLPSKVADEFSLGQMSGSHGIGHTRMATESGITTVHSHPFAAGLDLCLVHNGTISNHHSLRQWLTRHGGMSFESDNDSEVAAKYLAFRMKEGATLKEALEDGLEALDGFYTFCVGTEDGFAVMRDAFACKPAVIAETDDYVAMASEYRSLARLPGVEQAHVWEPKPETVYVWHREGRA